MLKAAAARRSASEKAVAEELVHKLEPLSLVFTRKSGEAGHLFHRHCHELADLAVHRPHVAHGLNDVAGSRLTLGPDHRRTLGDPP